MDHTLLRTLKQNSLNQIALLIILKCWNGDSPHSTLHHMDWLNAKFPQWLISHRSYFHWPARSPYLSLLSLEFWKERLFRAAPSNITQLKNQVREVIESIEVNTLVNVLTNSSIHIDKCFELGKGHFES